MRIIAHIDLDAFFASVEERDNPRWKGMPIVVGADPKEGRGRGVVSTANYKAREYGIGSAMPITRAWRLSEGAKKLGKPPAIFLPVNGKRYSEISDRVMSLVSSYSKEVERASIDEAYFDLSHAGSYADAKKLCRELKEKIFRWEKITASIGIGPNKLISKIAAGIDKPNGLTAVDEDETEKFLEPMSVKVLPGVGPKSFAALQKKEIQTIRDLKKLSQTELEKIFGKWGSQLYQKARGKNDSPIVMNRTVKSIGEQETFDEDTLNSAFLVSRLHEACGRVISRFNAGGFKSFKTIVITVRFSNFQTRSRSYTLTVPVGDLKLLKLESLKLFMPFLDRRDNPNKCRIRLIGVRIEKLK